MHNSSLTREKGSKIQNRLETNTTETIKTEHVITREYLRQYFDTPHPKDGTALNIIASLDDPNLNKINLINNLVLDGANKYKALEFAIQKKNYKQADYLIEHLNINVIEAIQNKNLTLVKYFIEEAGNNINTTYFGSNLLSLTADLKEPHKTEIT